MNCVAVYNALDRTSSLESIYIVTHRTRISLRKYSPSFLMREMPSKAIKCSF